MTPKNGARTPQMPQSSPGRTQSGRSRGQLCRKTVVWTCNSGGNSS